MRFLAFLLFCCLFFACNASSSESENGVKNPTVKDIDEKSTPLPPRERPCYDEMLNTRQKLIRMFKNTGNSPSALYLLVENAKSIADNDPCQKCPDECTSSERAEHSEITRYYRSEYYRIENIIDSRERR